MLESIFKLRERKTTVKKEIMAGVAVFSTMVYILSVNPAILGDAGMDKQAVLIATCLAAFIGSACMAFLSNYPFVTAPGMGLNAFFAYTVVVNMGYDFRVALLAVFVEGIIFIVLSVTNVREAVFNAIPINLKRGITAGLGLFITYIGLQKSGIVVASESTLTTCVSFGGDISGKGLIALLTLVGVLIIAILAYKKVTGYIFGGMIIIWIIGIALQLLGIYQVDEAAGVYSLIPTFEIVGFGSLSKTLGQCFDVDFASIDIAGFLSVVMAFLFVDFFDTVGIVIGLADSAGLMDKEGKLPKVRSVLLADAIATTVGAVLGTSTTTTWLESSSGIAIGGRTGLTAITTGVLFILSIFLAPIFCCVPVFAYSAALIYAGFSVMAAILRVDFADVTEAIPAFLTIIVIPFTYSVSDGIAIGIISYVIINIIAGNAKKISPVVFITGLLFICKYIFL